LTHARTEVIHWKGARGDEVEGILFYPHHYQPGTKYPLVVMIHGGCWQAAYDIDHIAATTAALADAGFAVWAPEYRRLGDDGGGWPGTFDDVSRAVDHVATLAVEHPRIDAARTILAGHSAGGHLALWAARRPGEKVHPMGVLGLAGICDLAAYSAVRGSCNDSVVPLLGGAPGEVPQRYRAANPIERLPLGVPVTLVHGELDPIVPVAMSADYAKRASDAGDRAELIVIPGAGHFDVVAPGTVAWITVLRALNHLVRTV
jgi:dipeptidyl aminopeptidase/acylaminoacyl peptidase